MRARAHTHTHTHTHTHRIKGSPGRADLANEWLSVKQKQGAPPPPLQSCSLALPKIKSLQADTLGGQRWDREESGLPPQVTRFFQQLGAAEVDADPDLSPVPEALGCTVLLAASTATIVTGTGVSHLGADFFSLWTRWSGGMRSLTKSRLSLLTGSFPSAPMLYWCQGCALLPSKAIGVA